MIVGRGKMSSNIDILAALTPSRRRWRDLTKRRLALGLFVAPILPVTGGGMLMRVLDPFGDTLDLATFCGAVLAAAILWSLAIGALYFVLIPRRTGVIGRASCLLLGIGLAASLPVAAALVAFGVNALSTHSPEDDVAMAFGLLPRDLYGLAVIVSLALIPFGALGGWVFWRVGVRPASPGASDLAGVFE